MEQGIPKEVMEEVEAKLEEALKDEPHGMGFCHIYWYHKKKYLKERGYDWKSPAELNPDVIYD